jgi:drug/metabolite transporter (DMT)-like permease
LCLLTQPIAAAAIGWFAYREGLSVADGIGALLICAALVLVQRPERVASDRPAAH